MWKALPAAVLGLLIGGTAYLIAAPNDGPSSLAISAGVPAPGVATVELKKPPPPPPRHRRKHGRSHVAAVTASPESAGSHQLIDSNPGGPPATGGGSARGHSHGSPDHSGHPRPLGRRAPSSGGSASDEDESGDENSQGSESHDHGSEDSQGDDSGD